PADVRRDEPYCGIQDYAFDVPTADSADAFGRYLVRIEEMRQSLRIVEQALARLEPGPVMVEDPKVRWPAQLAVGPDGIGNSEEYVRHIMQESMEALIHHFKIVTQGINVPPGEAYVAVESPRGELGFYVVSDGGQRPYRVHIRDPSFANLQSEVGWVPQQGLREVAEILGLTTAEVEAVATFYTMVKLYPCGKYVLSICTNPSCALVGGRQLLERARELLGAASEHGVSDDG